MKTSENNVSYFGASIRVSFCRVGSDYAPRTLVLLESEENNEPIIILKNGVKIKQFKL